ncbi:unnamed protein product [Brugia timori]|uniref:Mediator of RAP80 interactions and targeting subunit of 40 kDa n=1 Tax=Brugia timori TaxID=42155 RepID=A0A0R3RB76_9BILA|nr:unnamed protein product [Brugia timori]
MAVYLAVDSSLSMRLPVSESNEMSRRMIACQLVLKTIEKVQTLDMDRKIKLIDFSHNSKIIPCDMRSIEDAEKLLNCIDISASADLISLFLLVKMENDDETSILLVFTDACTFTPVVLTEGFKEEFDFEDSRPWMPYFLSDYDTIDSYSDALAKDLCPVPTFLLKCGFLKAYFKTLPSVDSDDWNTVIEVIGFIPVNYLANMPTIRHHFLISQLNSEDFLNLMCSSLHLEESVAICRLNKKLYGALCHIR